MSMLRGASGKEASTKQIPDMLNKSIDNLRRTAVELADIEVERSTDFTQAAEEVNFAALVEDVQYLLNLFEASL